MKKAFSRWLQERIPVDPEVLRKPLREALPVHLKIWKLFLGGTPMLLFIILAVTGIMLTFYYVPDAKDAYHAVSRITYKVRMGWFIRGVHMAAAQLMIVSVLLHMIRVFGTRAYRKPREFNWMFGVILLLMTLTFAFTGYSLVYDQLSYWATTVGTNMIGYVPLVGKPILYLLRGGPNVGQDTLSRFYNFHTGVLPTLMVLLLAGHIIFLRLHGVAKLEGDKRKETYPFFPDHMLKESIIGLLVLIAIVNYVIFFPPTMGPPADPSHTPAGIRPEWYFFPSYRWLKLVPVQVGLWGTPAFIVCMFFWPFIDAWFERIAPGRKIGMFVGTAGIVVTFVFTIWEAIVG